MALSLFLLLLYLFLDISINYPFSVESHLHIYTFLHLNICLSTYIIDNPLRISICCYNIESELKITYISLNMGLKGREVDASLPGVF